VETTKAQLMVKSSKPQGVARIPYHDRQLLAQYGPDVSALIEQRLYKRVEVDGRLRWEGLFEAISEVFAELRDAPTNDTTGQDPETMEISIDQHR
jgi:hypothetical protein